MKYYDKYSPSSSGVIVQGMHLDLNTVDTVDAVGEEDGDEDECDLEAIL